MEKSYISIFMMFFDIPAALTSIMHGPTEMIHLNEIATLQRMFNHKMFKYLSSFDLDPLRRHTFWTVVVGGSLMWVSIYSINQSQVQRYISCRTMTHAKM